MTKFGNNVLYLVLSQEYGMGRPAMEIARLAVSGGIDVLQMREKAMARAELIKLGRDLSCLCKDAGVVFIVNDDPAIALDVKADGVHLGQEDQRRFDIAGTRALLGTDKIIGVSTHSLQQFREANEQDVDYIAFGPIFPTKTKDYCIGEKDIEEVLRSASKPVVFIGGIDMTNVDGLLERGAGNIAVIRAIAAADDIRGAASAFKAKLARGLKMLVRVNGKDEIVQANKKLADLLSDKGIVPDHVVIEHNLKIVPRETWKNISLGNNDNVEIISFVGGG